MAHIVSCVIIWSLAKSLRIDVIPGFMFMCSWLRNLNEYGVCLLTNMSTELGTVKKVYNTHAALQYS